MYSQTHFTDTRLIRTRTDCFVPGERKPGGEEGKNARGEGERKPRGVGGKKARTFSLNATHLIRSLSMTPSVSVLTEFDCTAR